MGRKQNAELYCWIEVIVLYNRTYSLPKMFHSLEFKLLGITNKKSILDRILTFFAPVLYNRNGPQQNLLKKILKQCRHGKVTL